MKELHQENGRNWHKYAVTEDGLESKASINGGTTVKKLTFVETGMFTDNYEEYTERDGSISVGKRVLFVAVAFFIAAVFGALSQQFEEDSAAGVIFIVLAMITFYGSMIVGVWFSNRKAKFKRVFFETGAYCTFYSRNDEERKQIEEFKREYNKKYAEHAKERFLKELKINPMGLESVLERMHGKGIINETEYKNYLNIIELARNKHRN